MLINISYIVSIIIEIGIPVVLAIYMWKKYKISWAVFFLGMLLFLVSLSRIPLNNAFSSYITLKFSGDTALILAGLFVSLTAGIFEEGVRVLAFGLIIKSRSYEKAVMYAFLKRKYYFILIAILYHMTVDFISIYINYKFGIFLTEIMIFIFAGISIALIYILRPRKREFEKKETGKK